MSNILYALLFDVIAAMFLFHSVQLIAFCVKNDSGKYARKKK